MKKAWKIIGITLASLVGFVLLVVGVLCYLVFTPARLTPIVNQIADEYLTCPHTLDKVSLTYFRTFPYFGVEIDGLTVVNAMDGAPSDTVADIEQLLVSVDLLKAIDGDIRIKQLQLKNAQANVYINPDGASNIDILRIESDTTETDTTSGWQLHNLQIEEQIEASFNHLSFVNARDSIYAQTGNLCLSLQESDGYRARMDADQVNCILGTEQMLSNAHIQIDLPVSLCENNQARLKEASVRLNDLCLTMDGTIGWQDSWSEMDYTMDMQVGTNTWNIDTILTLLPKSYLQLIPSELSIAGQIELQAHAKGLFNDSIYPQLEAQLLLKQGEIEYATLPYHLSDVCLDVAATADLNQIDSMQLQIRDLYATTKQSELRARGTVSQLFDDMWLQLHLQPLLTLTDFRYFFPDDIFASGKVGGQIDFSGHVSELTNLQLDKTCLSADLQMQQLHYAMDNLTADIPTSQWHIKMPAQQAKKADTQWGDVCVEWDTLSVDMPGTLQAQMGEASLHAQCNNLLSDDVNLCAWADLSGKRQLHVAMDSLEATLKCPKLIAYTCYNMQDTNVMPVVDLQLDCQALHGYYTDIRARLGQTLLSGHLSGGKRNKAAPRLNADLTTSRIEAAIGDDTRVRSQKTHLSASARYNPKQSNLLLQWNPRLNVQLQEGYAELSSFALPIQIPQIDFSYSNKIFTISQSSIQLGHSDFELDGEIQNIGAWLREKGELVGELNFQSDYTDVNQLLELFSSDEGSEETADETPTEVVDTTANPFMVPKRVNISLNTHIRKASAFNETINDLKGRLYVNDGVVTLEEMGFTCKAAKLQLTAMYRTPRRNHIYVGLDYHMLDVDIAELIHILPQMDSIVPMLKSFKGKAEFHLAAETYLNAHYELKPSTIRGACSLYGKDLVVLDNETFTKISKLLMFNKKTENKVDSISAEITLYKDEIDVYPFCVSIDNYTAALGGRHNLDMSFDYHISLLSPLYLGVDVSGTFDNLDIRLANCRYAKDFKPILHRPVDTRSAELRNIIRQSMRKNVKIE